MLAARQQHRFPAQRPLLVDDAERAIDIAALQCSEWSRIWRIRIPRIGSNDNFPASYQDRSAIEFLWNLLSYS